MFFRKAFLLASPLSLLSAVVSASSQSNVTSALNAAGLSSGTQIFYPSDSNYTSETIQRWTTHDAPTYIASVKPATEDDVVKIIGAAVANNIPFLATGGSHGFTTTYGRLKQGLEIDMSALNSINVDKAAQTLTVGPGVHFADVLHPVYEAGFEVVTGSSGCVGMIGATIGGGVGRYNGLHGMILDTLLSVDFVTANGTRLTASKDTNSELFWGIRGAAANLGVILSATYQVFPLTSPTVMNWDMVFHINQSEPIMKWFKSMEDTMDPRFAPILMTIYDEALYGGFGILLNLVYIGPKEEGKKIVQPLLAKAGQPVRSALSEPTFADLTTTAFFDAEHGPCIRGQNYNVYAGSVHMYDVQAFGKFFHNMRHFYTQTPNAQISPFFIEHFAKSGAERFGADATAYPWRNVTAHLLYNFSYNDTSLDAEVDRFAQDQRALIQNSSGFQPEQIYVSYGHGDEGPQAWYGGHLERLSKLKSEWDPNDVFSFNNPVPQAK